MTSSLGAFGGLEKVKSGLGRDSGKASSQESRIAPADVESGWKGCGVTGDTVLALSRTFLRKGLSFCLSKMLELGRGRGTFASFLSLLRKCLSKFYRGPSIKQEHILSPA